MKRKQAPNLLNTAAVTTVQTHVTVRVAVMVVQVPWRDSCEQRAALKEKLNDVAEEMASVGAYGTVSVYRTEKCDSNTDYIIEKILVACPLLFTLEDILCNVCVSDLLQAKTILKVIQEVCGEESDNDLSDGDGEDTDFEELGAFGNINIASLGYTANYSC
ncbi:hypothetical protein ABVT39_021921 [Epinephelus coioides]